MQVLTLVKRGVIGLHDLLLPNTCAACGAPIPGDQTGADHLSYHVTSHNPIPRGTPRGTGSPATPLCTACLLDLARCLGAEYCNRCGRSRGPHLLLDGVCTACRTGRSQLRFSGFVRVGVYAGVLRAMIVRFKRRMEMDRVLGGLLGAVIARGLPCGEIDVWCGVPAHWRRRVVLGYQVTGLLVRAAVRTAAKPSASAAPLDGRILPVLKCTKYVPPFHMRLRASPKDRADAIRGAFAVREPEWVRGKTVCVIDDVMTTGATLGEAKRMLRGAGAARVYAAVLACTERGLSLPGDRD